MLKRCAIRGRCVNVPAEKSGFGRLASQLRIRRGFTVCRAGSPIVELVISDSLRHRVKVKPTIHLKRKLRGRRRR
jgi:hypothetical protein